MSIYYVAGVPYSSELYHHGIKGQRWGIRRFENTDGTLTPEGKERYTKKYLNKKIKENDRTIRRLKETSLNKYDAFKKRSSRIEEKLRSENAAHKEALERYNTMSEKDRRKIDRIMKLRNTGNSSFKTIARDFTDKYVDAKLYDRKKSNAEYVGKYIRSLTSIALPIVVMANSKKIGEWYVKRVWG